jgi:hypothetical protein
MKTIFVINVQHTIDLITNSSSELFVLRGKTKEAIMQMLDGVALGWRDEYEEPKNIAYLSLDEINVYFSYATYAHCSPARKRDYPVLKGFTFDELYEQDDDGRKAWNGEVQYRLRNNKHSEQKWDRDFVTEENREQMIEKLCPDKDMWFLFSFDENPNFARQEALESIASRYHLG